MFVQIAGIKYVPQDIRIRRDALDALDIAAAGPGGVTGFLGIFFGDVRYGWLFGSPNAFYLALTEVAALSPQVRAAGPLPDSVLRCRRAPGPATPAGTVSIRSGGFVAGGFGPVTRCASAADLVANTLVTGLTGNAASIRGAAATRLVNEPLSGYAFDSWAALATAVGVWNGVGAVPDAVGAGRVPFHPLSVLARWDPSVAVTAANAVDAMQRFEYAWATCGQTGEFLTGRVFDLGGDIRRENLITFGQGEGQALVNLLTADVNVRTFFEIHNPLLHHFIIEKRPEDQQAVLQQGYIGAYRATWWAGFTPTLMDVVGAVPRQEVVDARTAFGAATAMNLNTLGTRLSAFLAAPTVDSVAARAAWTQLPFLPSGQPNHSNPPSWVVTVWSINSPETVGDAVHDRLGGDFTTPWVSQWVMYEAATYRTQIDLRLQALVR